MAGQQTINTVNGINMAVLKETIQAIQQNPELGSCKFRARNKWVGGNHNCTIIDDFYGAGQEQRHKQPFELHDDEPAILAGEDRGANPVEHLLNALAGCMTTSMVAHAAVRGIHIEQLESELEGDIDLNGFLGLDNNVPKGYTNIRIKFKVKADVNNLERLKRLTEYSPVYNTLLHGVNVDVEVEAK